MSPRHRPRRDRDRRDPRWMVVADGQAFARQRRHGHHRIEVRRTATDPPLAAPIALGDIPTSIEVRVTGTAAVSIDGGQLRVSDAGHVEARGNATVHAYDNATVTAFDNATVTGHHRARITLCDTSRATGYDTTAIALWDDTHAHAHNTATVVVGDAGAAATVHLADDAHVYATATADLPITGPARNNVVRSPDPFGTAPTDLDY